MDVYIYIYIYIYKCYKHDISLLAKKQRYSCPEKIHLKVTLSTSLKKVIFISSNINEVIRAVLIFFFYKKILHTHTHTHTHTLKVLTSNFSLVHIYKRIV